MKRVISFLLVFIIGFSNFSVLAFGKNEKEIVKAVTDVISNEYAFDTCDVYFCENICYMSVEDIARYTRSSYEIVKNKLTISHGSRKIEINLSNGNLTEDNISENVKFMKNGDFVVLHAYPMLTYLGAKCGVEKGCLIINMPQVTIWEGVLDCEGENYFSLEEFGNQSERQLRIALNGLLEIFDSGICNALSSEKQLIETFTTALSVDPFIYESVLNEKNDLNGKYAELLYQVMDNDDYSYEFSDFIDDSHSLITDMIGVGFDKFVSLDAVDKKSFEEFINQSSTSIDLLKDTTSVLETFNENISFGNDAYSMIDSFSRHMPVTLGYQECIATLKLKTNSTQLKGVNALYGEAAKVLISEGSEALLDFVTEKSNVFLIGKQLAWSVNIGSMVHKLIYGEHNGIAYSKVETDAMYLMSVREDLTDIRQQLAEKILKENYSNSQDIEDYRLLTVLHYRIQIAINLAMKKLIEVQGRENNADMNSVIENIEKYNAQFARNLYFLTISKGEAFSDIAKNSKNNTWDDKNSLGLELEKLTNGLKDLGRAQIVPVGKNIKVDDIQYIQTSDNYNFFIYEKDGKFGTLSETGEIIEKARFSRFYEVLGPYAHFVDYPIVFENSSGVGADYLSECYFVHSDGKAYFDENYIGYPGGDVPENVFWYNDGIVWFHMDTGIFERTDEYNWSFYEGDRQVEIGSYVWSGIIPMKEISGVRKSEYGWNEPVFKSDKYALVDMKTETKITDFTYDSFSTSGFSDGLLAVMKDGKWGFINEKGETIIDFNYDSNEKCEYSSIMFDDNEYKINSVSNGYITVNKNGKFGVINCKGEEIISCKFDNATNVNQNGYLWLSQNGTWELYKINK